jgi:hypothetical protein
VKLFSQYLRAAASLSAALDGEFGARALSRRGCPRTSEVFLEIHRDPVAAVHNSNLYCPTVFVLHCLVDRFLASAHHKSENTVTICEIRCGSQVDWATLSVAALGYAFCVGLKASLQVGGRPALTVRHPCGTKGKAAGCVPPGGFAV